MALTIISESYGARKPLVVCEADSMEDLAGLVCAEGSEATVGGTTYVLDRVNGWIEPGGGGGSSGNVLVVNLASVDDVQTCDKTAGEMYAAAENGVVVFHSTDPEVTDVFYLDMYSHSEESGYYFHTTAGSDPIDFYALSATDYPATQSEEPQSEEPHS